MTEKTRSCFIGLPLRKKLKSIFGGILLITESTLWFTWSLKLFDWAIVLIAVNWKQFNIKRKRKIIGCLVAPNERGLAKWGSVVPSARQTEAQFIIKSWSLELLPGRITSARYKAQQNYNCWNTASVRPHFAKPDVSGSVFGESFCVVLEPGVNKFVWLL